MVILIIYRPFKGSNAELRGYFEVNSSSHTTRLKAEALRLKYISLKQWHL